MKLSRQLLVPVVGILIVLAINLFLSPNFFHIESRDGRLYGSIIDILNRAAPVWILATGMTLVIATGGIDLTVGSVMAISGSVAAGIVARPPGFVLNSWNIPSNFPVAAIAALSAALLAGMFNGALIAYLKLQPIVATLLLMVAGRGIAQLLSDGQTTTFTDPQFVGLANGATLGLPNPFLIAVGIMLIVAGLFRLTSLATYVEAVGLSNPVADIVGIRGPALRFWIYGLCALLAGVAGLLYASNIRAADSNQAGLYYELDAILAVAIGGTSLTGGRFFLFSSALSAILIQALTTTMLGNGIATEITLVVKAVVIIVVCALQGPQMLQMRERTA